MAKKDGERIYITNVPPAMKEKVENIADHKGISTVQFLKSEIHKMIESYPEYMRKPMKKD